MRNMIRPKEGEVKGGDKWGKGGKCISKTPPSFKGPWTPFRP
jgi:hypothetical protein